MSNSEEYVHWSVAAQARNATISNLVQILEDQKLRKRDLVVPSTHISMQGGKLCVDDAPDSSFLGPLLSGTGVSQPTTDTQGPDRLSFSVLSMAHSDISQKLGIPKKFYDRLLQDHSDLIDTNVTTLFQRAETNYFIRTFMGEGETGVVRAVLSDRYKAIDHFDVLYTSLLAIKTSGVACRIESCDLSERRMRVRFYRPDVDVEAQALLRNYRSPRVGMRSGHEIIDTNILCGFQITNSETGDARFTVTPRFIVKACSNGFVMRSDAIGKTHLGSQMQAGIIEWSEETRKLEMQLILAQVSEAVLSFLDPSFLKVKIDHIVQTNRVLSRPVDATENVANLLHLNEDEREALLSYYTSGGDPTAWGLAQAVTALAYDTASAERAEELETGALEAFEIALATTK